MTPTMAKKPAHEPLPTWEITHIKGTPTLIIGRVDAADYESAIDEAMKRFGLKGRVRERLAAQRIK